MSHPLSTHDDPDFTLYRFPDGWEFLPKGPAWYPHNLNDSGTTLLVVPVPETASQDEAAQAAQGLIETWAR